MVMTSLPFSIRLAAAGRSACIFSISVVTALKPMLMDLTYIAFYVLVRRMVSSPCRLAVLKKVYSADVVVSDCVCPSSTPSINTFSFPLPLLPIDASTVIWLTRQSAASFVVSSALAAGCLLEPNCSPLLPSNPA